MNKAANIYWADDRLRAQRIAARELPAFAPPRDLSRELIGTRAEVRRRGGIIPSWVIFVTIILATFALCVTVTMRTRAEMRTASAHYQKVNTDVELLRTNNAALREDVRRLRTDKRAIEAAARERLYMGRTNEIIIPVE